MEKIRSNRSMTSLINISPDNVGAIRDGLNELGNAHYQFIELLEMITHQDLLLTAVAL